MLTRIAVLTVAVVQTWAGLAGTELAAGDSDRTAPLVAVLRSDAGLFEKARACQQLGEFGEESAVPALAALLADEHLNAYARSGLEGIGGSRAAEALRQAAASLRKDRLCGVIDSLGRLRDEASVGLLQKRSEDPDLEVAGAALRALGSISVGGAKETVQAILRRAEGRLRDEAAAACLLAAQRELADGRAGASAELCDAVRAAYPSGVFRVAATRGAVLARGDGGIPLLLDSLRSADAELQEAAFTAIRELAGAAVAGALNRELASASGELARLLLTALVDCHDSESFAVIRVKAVGDEAEVRRTALTVLGRIGGEEGAAVLLDAVTGGRTAEERDIALDGLRRLEGTAVDAMIEKRLEGGESESGRLDLIRLLGERGARAAAGGLLRQASDVSPKIQVAALRALKATAGASDLDALMQVLTTAREGAVREAGESAILAVCARTGSVDAGTAAVVRELDRAVDSSLKVSWIRILVSLGRVQGLSVVLKAVGDADLTVATNALVELGRWPDAGPAEELSKLLGKSMDESCRKCALRSLTLLAIQAATDRQSSNDDILRWLHQAGTLAKTVEEQRLILSGLGRVADRRSLDVLKGYLGQALLADEAMAAVLNVASTLGPSDPAAVRTVLEEAMAATTSLDLRDRASKLMATLPEAPPWLLLFDGRTLAGWEGDTRVWRVRDGTIVGGSMEGNSQNEFLVTTRGYTNFVLLLEYRLVGTEGFVNGGVQFRSGRVSRPTNEMSGFQADIGAGYSGCLYDESRRNKFLVQAPEEQIRRLERVGEWNAYEVRCAGDRIQIRLNGETTVDYEERDEEIAKSGLIGLQIHGGCKAEIAFRGLQLQELPEGADAGWGAVR